MKLSPLAAAVALLGVAGSVLAQTPAAQRVEITGSSIKRIAAAGALPVQVITRQDLERDGITSAEQVVMMLSTNGTGLDNLAANADVVSGAQRGNNGASSANLRGQGANATLVLLNGRRVAAHGLNGGVVDLNQIPMAAVERIEVLKDGASAIYGTDAIGGVINFILRSNFNGLRASAFADVTEAGGGNIYRGSLTGGFGDLDRNGYNLLATLALAEHKALRGDQRGFVNTFQPNRGLSVDTRGTPHATIFPFAGTIIPNSNAAPFIPGTTTRASGGINILDLPGAEGCGSIDGQAPYDEQLWNSPTAGLACAWDTGRAAVLQQPLRNLNLVTRGTVRFGQHQLAVEAIAARSEAAKRFSNIQLIPNTTTQQLRYPRNAASAASYDLVFNRLVAAFPELEPQRGQPINYRWRCIECGPREIKTETDTRRLFAGLDGPLAAGWDYRAGLMQATSESQSQLGNGYYYRGTDAAGNVTGPGLIPVLNSGQVNVFLMPGQTQSAAGLAALESASARGVVLYGGKYTVTQADASVSGPVFKLPGGDAMAAVGLDLRNEKYRFTGDERDLANRSIIIGAPFDDANALPGVKRDIKAVYAELLLPITKTIETTLAVRTDDYDGFGRTTNPKVSALWKPSNQFLVRGSYNTGFRVPTFNQLFNGTLESLYSGADLVDPTRCATLVVDPSRPGCDAIRPIILTGGKTDLGPEEAKMASVGLLWEPTAQISIGLDWWRIDREGTIDVLGVQTLVRNHELFPNRFLRAADGTLVAIDNRWVNTGETQTEGVELSVRGGFDAMGARWTAGLEGTYLLKKRSRLVPSAAWGPSEVGRYTFSGDLGLRWKHNAYVSYKRGDWTASLSQIHRSGYNDFQLPGVASGRIVPPDWKAKVDSYTIYNVSAAYSGVRNLTITVGVKNLLDTDPPYATNYDSNFGSGSSWEPRVADPRGRSYTLQLEYSFF